MERTEATSNQVDPRRMLAEASLIVLKVGTSLLTGGDPRLDQTYMHDLAASISRAWDSGRRVILISSGAVGAGLESLGLHRRPTDLSLLQAAAAAGQPLLMDIWRDAFAVRKIHIAQLLVSRSDFDARDRFLNIRNCVSCLLDQGILPILNENDSVATEEISLGDNDVLAAKFASSVQADALVILSTVDGVQTEEGERVSRAEEASHLLPHVRGERSAQGTGGMATKVEAARIATMSGIPTVIAAGRPAERLREILAGDDVGTAVDAPYARHAGRRLWIALAATPAGTLDVDPGAAEAVSERGASLLAKGITSVTGRFNVGDVVVVRDHRGKEIARGLSNFTSAEIRDLVGVDSKEFQRILGRKTHDEVIHRDNLALSQ